MSNPQNQSTAGIVVFRTIRWIGKLWLPVTVRNHISNIGFYEYTVRELNPTLPPVTVMASIGLAEIWPRQERQP